MNDFNLYKRPYLVLAPSFTQKSGGIIVQHKLVHLLNKLGANAYLCHHKIDGKLYFETNDKYSTPIASKSIMDEDPIVVYAEIVIGNPLNAKNVVRWLLNRPGDVGGDGNFSNSDLIYEINTIHFTENTPENPNMLTVHERYLDIFKDYGGKRNGSCFLVHKGNRDNIDLSLHSLDDEITDFSPNQKLADYFNTKEYFYSYDSATIMSHLAALCGVKSIIIPDGSRTKEELLEWIPYGVAIGFQNIAYQLK